ncbi:MAG: ECF transporter S component [Clostridiales Family XIII bacterium]|jgi:energy-coupling factor transport system substrate-specific component|nr:ECF transporter S component [Clostridiales Family XIII bacterium]
MTVDGHVNYYAVSLAIAVCSMLPFVLAFEGRKPQARELVVIAVMVAIIVVSRAAFFMLPHFKPAVAIVIIAGAALGAQSGFVCGALAAFVSNFLFGQGPWTPWQMLALGLIGCLSGLVFSGAARLRRPRPGLPGLPGLPGREEGAFASVRARKRAERLRTAALCAFGFLITFALYGLLLDTAAVAIFSSGIQGEALIATYAAGIPLNLVHAAGTAVFLAVFARPMIEKLERVRVKYGLYGGRAAGCRPYSGRGKPRPYGGR